MAKFYMLVHPSLFNLPLPSSSSPLCEPQAKMKPQGDFSLNQLWLPTIIQRANNEPSLWEQSKPNVCSADNVSNQDSLHAWQLCKGDKEEEKIMCVCGLVQTQQRYRDNLEVREFIQSVSIIFFCPCNYA